MHEYAKFGSLHTVSRDCLFFPPFFFLSFFLKPKADGFVHSRDLGFIKSRVADTVISMPGSGVAHCLKCTAWIIGVEFALVANRQGLAKSKCDDPKLDLECVILHVCAGLDTQPDRCSCLVLQGHDR